MAADENSTVDQVRNAVANLPGPVKIGIVALVIIGVVWFIWSSIATMMRSWEPIAVRLDGSAKADVLEYLRDNRVEYKIEGGSIFVPADQADELRIEMAGLDLQVTQLRGLERLEEVGMGDTEKTIAAKRQLALQEEIQKTLNSLNAVETSQVNLALPPDSGFITREEIPAKASIVLKLRGSQKLSTEQIRGIQVLVAYSVQGLNADNVIIVDQHSNPLSQSGDDNALFNMASLDEEKRIIQNVRKLLEPTFGTTRFTVAASVELNRESRRETKKEIDTNSPAEVTFESSEEEEEGGTSSGGVPGAESNTGDPSAVTSGGSQTSRSVTSEKRQTDYPTTLIETSMGPGEIKRKSVSVVIDLQETTTQDESGQEVTQYVTWGADRISNWEEALKKAAGIDDRPEDQGGRGDSFTLTEISFDHNHQITQQIQVEQRTQVQRRMFDIFEWSDWTALVKIPLLITIIFVIFWFVIRPIGKVVLEPIMALPSRAAAQIPEELPKTVEELEAEIEGKLEDEIDMASKEVTKGTILKKRISELAKNEPESFTQLLRTWLNE